MTLGSFSHGRLRPAVIGRGDRKRLVTARVLQGPSSPQGDRCRPRAIPPATKTGAPKSARGCDCCRKRTARARVDALWAASRQSNAVQRTSLSFACCTSTAQSSGKPAGIGARALRAHRRCRRAGEQVALAGGVVGRRSSPRRRSRRACRSAPRATGADRRWPGARPASSRTGPCRRRSCRPGRRGTAASPAGGDVPAEVGAERRVAQHRRHAAELVAVGVDPRHQHLDHAAGSAAARWSARRSRRCGRNPGPSRSRTPGR